MAVKPLTQPLYWATDAVYSTGPFVGQPQKVTPPLGFAAEGHRPGALFPTPAEYENSQQYNLTGLARWVFAGSSAGAADAHVLESDAAGRTAATGLTINDAVDETAVSITAAATAANFALLVSCVTGGTAVATSIGNASAINYLGGTGSGAGAEGVRISMSSTPNTGSGVRVNADASTAAPAMRIEHAGSGNGMLITHTGSGDAMLLNNSGGTGTSLSVFGNASIIAATVVAGAGQVALQAIAGNNAATALAAIGAGSSLGIESTGGNGSSAATAVRGTATHPDAAGIHGRTTTSASTTAAGVLAEGRGAGTMGLYALNTVGRAAVFQGDASSPAYAATRWVPQDTDPTAGTSDGEVFWHADHRTLRTNAADAGWRSLMAMGPGSALYVASSQPHNDKVVAAGYTTLLVLSCSESTGTGVFGGGVQITFSCDTRSVSGAAAYLSVRVTDTTNSFTIAEWTSTPTDPDGAFRLSAATNEWQRAVTFGLMYDPFLSGGSYGDMSILIEVAGSPTNVEVRNATATVVGTFVVI